MLRLVRRPDDRKIAEIPEDMPLSRQKEAGIALADSLHMPGSYIEVMDGINVVHDTTWLEVQ